MNVMRAERARHTPRGGLCHNSSVRARTNAENWYAVFPSPLVGEGGAKRRMRGYLRECCRERITCGENPSPVSPLRGDPPSPTRGEGNTACHECLTEDCRRSAGCACR